MRSKIFFILFFSNILIGTKIDIAYMLAINTTHKRKALWLSINILWRTTDTQRKLFKLSKPWDRRPHIWNHNKQTNNVTDILPHTLESDPKQMRDEQLTGCAHENPISEMREFLITCKHLISLKNYDKRKMWGNFIADKNKKNRNERPSILIKWHPPYQLKMVKRN